MTNVNMWNIVWVRDYLEILIEAVANGEIQGIETKDSKVYMISEKQYQQVKDLLMQLQAVD